MVYLSIKNGQGFFLNSNNEMQPIHEIRKEDILRLLDYATDEEVDFEMDEFKNGNIQNQAHRIIYEGIYLKFEELVKSRSRFRDECENLYKDALEKYKNS